MKPLRSIGTACVAGLRGAWTVVLWTLWLGLALLFVLQLYVLSTSELAVPEFMLRRLERQIAESGLRATFGRTSFDPTGRVLIENARFSLPTFAEPVLTARAIYVQVNPWSLAVGRFEPRQIRVTGANAAVPAMLSSSGRPEEILRDLDATLVPDGRQMVLRQFSGRIAGINVTAHGALMLTALDPDRPKAPLAEVIAAQFPKWCRQAIAVADRLDALEAPALHLELKPSETRGALVEATLFARGLNLTTPLPAQIRGLRIVTQLPLLGDIPTSSRLDLVAGELRLPLEATARDVRASLTGRFAPLGFQFTPDELQVTAGAVEAAGFAATALSAQLRPQPLPKLEAAIVMRLMGAPLQVDATTDFREKRATLRFAGALAPEVLTPLSARLKADVRRWFDFAALDVESGEVRLGPDWKFEKLNAQVAVRGIDAYKVKMEEGRATLELEPGRLFAPMAYARIGDNFARGSYEQDLRTREYRFLLDGRLRPLDISGWFREWWPRFFAQLDFRAAAPDASVEVAGVWREGWRTSVFVFGDVAKPVIRGAAFDRVRTRLFIRPGFYDGLELLATSGPGAARGTFTYTTNPQTAAMRRLDLALDAKVDLALAEKVMGPLGTRILSPFKIAQPPEVKLTARLDGAEAPGGAHQTIDLAVRAGSEFRFQGFPLEHAAFTATVRDNEIAVDHVQAGFGGGTTTGRAKVTGVGDARRVSFDFTLKEAVLGRAAASFQRFMGERRNRPPAPPGKYVQEKANVRLDLSAAAEGRFNDPLSYRGLGSAALQGPEIGEVPLLGLLSELLKFTALRFTHANAQFKIEGAKLAFGDVKLRGANSAIDAHGDYLLDRQELDFKAKLFPFQESDSIIKGIVGAVLSPISNVFEVKLTGSLEKPEWAFVIGPTNLLRSLAPGTPESSPPPEGKTPAAPPAATTPPVDPAGSK